MSLAFVFIFMLFVVHDGKNNKNAGHIELPVPVYHPLLFRTLFRLLKGVCLNCHKLKGDRYWVRLTRLRLALVDAGEASIAQKLEEGIQLGGGDGPPSINQERSWEFGSDVKKQKEESDQQLSSEKKGKPTDELKKAEYNQNAL